MVAPASGVAREQSAGRALLAACPAAFLATLSALAVSPFLPSIAQDLHTSVALLGQIPAVMMLLAAALGLVVGPLADSLGRRRVLLVGVLAVAASSLTIALAPGYAALLVAALFGAGSRAIVVPVANAIV